tara:strand:+ start:14 stop:427 length:414 start_codon:yes stop_codon:yes gene_type:complete
VSGVQIPPSLPKKNMQNVVAAVIKKNDYYLIVQRNRNKHLAWKWEFPGGKVNKNETFENALTREIYEELNLYIHIERKITKEYFKDTKINIILHYYLCIIESGTLKLNEHEKFIWVKKNDFYKYNFAGSDAKITSFL